MHVVVIGAYGSAGVAVASELAEYDETEMDVREIPDRAFHPTTPEILDGLFREASAQLE